MRSPSSTCRGLFLLLPMMLLIALVAEQPPAASAQLKLQLPPGGLAGRNGVTREKLIKEGGGNDQSEAAVDAGLAWLAGHQAPDGHWSFWEFPKHGKCDCFGVGQAPPNMDKDEIGATALGLLPLLGRGQTHKAAKAVYGKQVERGLKYLLARQGADGHFGESSYYTHGLATIVLCEAYGLTADPTLKAPAQRAVAYVVKGQQKDGGWSYLANQPGDTLVTAWEIQALFAASQSGQTVPRETLTAAIKFLDSVGSPDGSVYGYKKPEPVDPTVTAMALLSRQLTGWPANARGLVKGSESLQKLPPSPNFKNLYFYHFATRVLYNLGGDDWQRWNTRMRDRLIDSQDQGKERAHQKGSWSAEGDAWSPSHGRLGITSLALLTLEVYYRHLPMYGEAK